MPISCTVYKAELYDCSVRLDTIAKNQSSGVFASGIKSCRAWWLALSVLGLSTEYKPEASIERFFLEVGYETDCSFSRGFLGARTDPGW